MAKFKLPNRKWYTLQQAADKLSREAGEPVTVDDLIHYQAIGLIRFFTYLNYDLKTLTIGNVNIPIKDVFYFGNYKNDNKNEELRQFMSLKLINIVDARLFDDKALESTPKNCHCYYIKGFVCILGHALFEKENRLLKERSFKLSRFNFLHTPRNEKNERVLMELECSEYNPIIIPLDEFVILDEDLEDFKKGIFPTPFVMPQNKTKEPSEPVKQRQIDFIRALLLVHYDTKDPEEVRALVNNGKLGRSCLKKGISIPTGETVRNWLKI